MNGQTTRLAVAILGLVLIFVAISLAVCSVLEVRPDPSLSALGWFAAGALAAWANPSAAKHHPPQQSPLDSAAALPQPLPMSHPRG